MGTTTVMLHKAARRGREGGRAGEVLSPMTGNREHFLVKSCLFLLISANNDNIPDVRWVQNVPLKPLTTKEVGNSFLTHPRQGNTQHDLAPRSGREEVSEAGPRLAEQLAEDAGGSALLLLVLDGG